MRKIKIFLKVVSILATLTILAGCKSDVDKAQEFMSAGMYKQAVVLLEKEIDKKPANANAHFLLGTCNAALGNIAKAEDNFASAIRIKPDLGKKIGAEMLQLSRHHIKEELSPLEKTRRLLELSVEYDPSLKTEIAQLLLQRAPSLTDDIQVREIARLAIQYDENSRHPAAQILLDNSEKAFKQRDYQRGLTLIAYAKDLRGEIDENAPTLISDTIESLKENVSKEFLKTFIQQSLTLCPNAENRIINSLLVNAKGLLERKMPALAVARLETLIETGLTPPNTREIELFLLECANELIENDEESFCRAVEMAVGLNPEIARSENIKNKYLYGVYLWLSGFKNQSIEVLRVVAENTNLVCLDFISQPLPTRKYPVGRHFKYDADYFFKERSFSFDLNSIEIFPTETIVNIAISNHTSIQTAFLCPYTQTEREKSLKEAKDFLAKQIAEDAVGKKFDFYLLDDFGNKYSPKNKTYFGTSPRSVWKNFWRGDAFRLELLPNREIREKIIFPEISSNATSVIFVLPEIAGSQPEIKFENIILRKIAFTKFPDS